MGGKEDEEREIANYGWDLIVAMHYDVGGKIN